MHNSAMCGGFVERNEIPAEESSTNYFSVIYNDNSRVLRSIVDKSLGKTPKPAPGNAAEEDNLKKLQDLWDSCMDEAAILKAGRSPISGQIDNLLGFLPDNNSSSGGVDKTAITKTVAQVNKLGLNTFLNILVGSDPGKPLTNSLSVWEGGLGLPTRKLYEVSAVVALYQTAVAQMFQIILGDEDVANRTEPLLPNDIAQQWTDTAKDVVDFETKMAAIGTDLVDQRDPLKYNNPRTVEELTSMIPSIDWPLLIKEVLPEGVQNTRPIVVATPIFFPKLDALIKDTSTATLRNYFTWLVIRNQALNLAEPYSRPITVLLSTLNGISPGIKVDRSKTCISTINTNLGEAAGHYFILEKFKGDSRAAFTEVFESLKTAYIKTFPTYDWLDKATLDNALKKLKTMEALVGYSTGSPDVPSSLSVKEYYEGYDVVADDYFGNQLRSAIFLNSKMMALMGKPVDRKKMLSYPQMVNAYYNPFSNQVFHPSGMLQFPFYHVENPDYINYGAMGSITGHEITHAFDTSGSHFDSIGTLVNWWTNATLIAFNDKAQCFVDQYGNFTIKGPDERFKSDSSGKKYKNFKLPGLDKYTPEQLFFISYGRLWCNKERPELAVQMISTDTHSPTRWRVNGALMNLPEFSEVFQCKPGSTMNPTKRCSLW
ncbi:hypothetical protein BGZ95_007864 [Linnemannia exigua]|uniref:Endothelin-converting enzyme 1 n=1 Tax=Linnemannia exigua TaxID=604196 RepID=A0AAD4DEV2_9FUNG|nr:hypothetical protein BGZ95_007864 [Linnemannia exigua]